jgi:hypothetical protein
VPVGDPAALAAALAGLLLDAERREALGRAGRRRFEQEFTADRMVNQTLLSYDELRGPSAVPERPAGSVADERSGCLTALGGIRGAAVSRREVTEKRPKGRPSRLGDCPPERRA